MTCEIPALLAVLKIALSVMDSGHLGPTATTLECTTCKCPTYASEVIQCKLDEQKHEEQAYREVEALITACEE